MSIQSFIELFLSEEITSTLWWMREKFSTA